GLSVAGLLVGLALFLAFLDANDNHKVRQMELMSNRTAEQIPGSISLEKAFDHWLHPRQRTWSGKTTGVGPYPVYVIAARGGGIYAAAHTASLLSTLADLYPTFVDHIFAISAVSGGSLGAGIFSALVDRYAQEMPGGSQPGWPWYSDRARWLLSQ